MSTALLRGGVEPARLRAQMGLVATIDARLAGLAEAGLIPPHQPCDGEEAVLVGAASALQPKDWVFWGRQVNAAALWRGLPLDRLLAHAMRGEAASEIAALRVVVCTQGPAARLPHATGLAWAGRQDGVVALCELGDAAVSDGDFHVGLNFAGVMNAPVIFIIRRGEGAPLVVERAEGYGIRGVVVDGSDPVLVRDAVASAAERARAGEGPTLIEAGVTRGVGLVADWERAEHAGAVETALAAAERVREGD